MWNIDIMINFCNREDFEKHIIGKDDCCDYSESGYVAVYKNGEAALTRYSHCSCYGTWTDIMNTDGVNRFDWCGTIEELVDMANRIADPAIPERNAITDDYDYEHLVNTYKQILEWYSIGCFLA